MQLAELGTEEISKQISTQGLAIKIGPVSVRIKSSLEGVIRHIISFYTAYEINDADFDDFHLSLEAPSILRKWIRPQVIFLFDGHQPFMPLPLSQAAAMFEWGLNWCIAHHSNQFLIIHAAVVELNGNAFILPGAPGNGKSTLCAALVCKGWRLLSDEMTLVSMENGQIYPIPRPVSLKNKSIEVISDYSADAVFGEIVHDTAKGSIAHMRAPDSSIYSSDQVVTPAKIIFPKYKQGALTELTLISKGKSVLKAAEQCFNYSVLGAQGFESLCALVDVSDCYEFSYSCLDEAIELFTELAC
ncbi:MAG: HprK-related kinase A [Methyloprofundus sp.]|nr:HprK-related kinase A [Methyloprofundus sp.]MDT8425654.1 HprK-related kinase A [Methyloprofundus sp.]